MSKVLTVCFVLLLSVQSTGEVVVPGDDFVPGWTRSDRTLHFSESNLYNYINGGAELFLEFGFQNLLVQRYRKGEPELGLELYRMQSPDAALGIYLMRCGDETPVEGIEARNSGDSYQFNIVKGGYFIQVNSFEGSDSLLPAMVALAQEILQTVPEGDSVRLLNHLPQENLVAGSELIIRGPYALQPIFTFGKGDVLQLKGKVFGVVGDYMIGKRVAGDGPALNSEGGDNDVYTRIIILYPDEKTASSAYRNLVANMDVHSTILDTFTNGFTFKDYQDRFGTVEMKGNVLELKVNLPEKPIHSSNRKQDLPHTDAHGHGAGSC